LSFANIAGVRKSNLRDFYRLKIKNVKTHFLLFNVYYIYAQTTVIFMAWLLCEADADIILYFALWFLLSSLFLLFFLA